MEGACVHGKNFVFPSNSYFNRTIIITPFALAFPLHSAAPGLGHIDSRKEAIEGFYVSGPAGGFRVAG